MKKPELVINVGKTLNNFVYMQYRTLFNRDNNIWIFGEWFGNRCVDNSAYLANYVAEIDENIKVIWICNKNVNTSFLNKKIMVVERDSKKAVYYLKHAGVAVMGQNFYDFSSKGKNYFGGAITFNLWHGVMWKKLGNNIQSKTLLVQAYYKIFYLSNNAKYYEAPSEQYAKVMCEAFGAEEKYIIRAGNPRNSLFYDKRRTIEAKQTILNLLKKKSSFQKWENVKIITYMPTFRDKTKEIFVFEKLAEDLEFRKILEKYNIVIVQKEHFVNSLRHDMNNNYMERIINIDDVNTQYLLAATDLLITDYSSCFFDFLLLNRPIIHFLYDYEYYKNHDRGLYYEKEEVTCGSMVQNRKELLKAIVDNIENPNMYEKRRNDMRKKWLPYETSDSSKRIYEEIVRLQEINKKKRFIK